VLTYQAQVLGSNPSMQNKKKKNEILIDATI
jgi:hypothetical protein